MNVLVSLRDKQKERKREIEKGEREKFLSPEGINRPLLSASRTGMVIVWSTSIVIYVEPLFALGTMYASTSGHNHTRHPQISTATWFLPQLCHNLISPKPS